MQDDCMRSHTTKRVCASGNGATINNASFGNDAEYKSGCRMQVGNDCRSAYERYTNNKKTMRHKHYRVLYIIELKWQWCHYKVKSHRSAQVVMVPLKSVE